MSLSMVFLAKETPTEIATAVPPPKVNPKEPPPASAVILEVSLALMLVNPALATMVLLSI